MESERPYRGVNADVRRQRRRVALLESALDLLGSDDAELSIRGVCAGAKLTQRYFYESFPSLDELKLALFAQIAADVAVQGAAAISDHSPTGLFDACRTAFEGAYSIFEQDPRKARAALIVASGTDGLLEARRTVVMSYAEAMGAFIGKDYGDAVGSPQARLALLYAVGGALEVTHAVLNGDVQLSHGDLCDAVGELLASSVEQLRSPDRTAW